MWIDDLKQKLQPELQGARVFNGAAATGAQAPYVVLRGISTTPDTLTLEAQPMAWGYVWGAYCVGSSPEASYNLAVAAVQALQGRWAGDSLLSCEVAYTGLRVEGLYESLVQISVQQGRIQ